MKFIKKNLRIIIIISFCSLCIFMIIKNWNDNKKLEKNHKFTIGTINEIRGAKGGPIAVFTYNVNGKLYTGDLIIGDQSGRVKENQRVYLKYCTEEPDLTETILYPPVTDSIKYVPANGWDKLPVNDTIK